MTNLYSDKTIDKIKKRCKLIKDIPLELFRSAVMNTLGTSYKNTEIWIKNYEDAKKIRIDKINGDCWVVNWLI